MSEQLSPLGSDLRALLDAERHVPAAPAAVQARVLARVEVTLGLVPVPTTLEPVHDPWAPKPAAATKPLLAKVAALASKPLVSVVLAATAAGGGALWYSQRAPAPVVLAPAVPVVPPPVVLAPAPVAAPAVVAPPPPVAPARPSRAERDASLREERALLERARADLVGARPRDALTAVKEHRRRYPHGQLGEEREVLWIQALTRSGDRTRAEARAAHFRTRYPTSIQLPVVEAILSPR